MPDGNRSWLLLMIGGLLIAAALALVGGGGWLIALGGSWYYVAAGLGLLLTGLLLLARRPSALVVYALVVLGTLAWALWEVGFDWWPLAARGGVVFVIGILLLLPWVTRRLTADGIAHERRLVSALRGAELPLVAVLAVALVVAVVSWFTDPHRIEGRVATAGPGAAQPALGAHPVPEGEWHAYGRTGYGQRYSPLDQITPRNVGNLEVAWTYRTGDMRGQPGDPVETTFQVTPLKIGDRLFLCTPHQFVIALDATTGEEIWRYDPDIRGALALQHLTCRGLSYHASAAAADTAADTAAPTGATPSSPGSPPDGEIRTSSIGLPVAAEGASVVEDCPAKLFMPTADGRLIALDPDRLIVVGGTVLDNVSTTEPSGVIRAFDVDTGALVWNWDPGRPDETAPIDPGETYVANSPNSWSISSVDEDLGLIYVPLGNQPPDQWGGNRGPAAERFSSSVVALDLATGTVRWVFQTVHHDLWDYDVPSQPSLVDLTMNGETVPALVQPTKQGEIYVLDRRTGEPILPVTEVPAPQGAAAGDWTAATQPVSELSYGPPPLQGSDMWGATLFDQLACRIAFHRLRYDGRYTPPSTQGSLIHPGNFGVFNWGSVAVDPARQIAFTTPAYLAFVSRLVPRQDDTTLYVQGDERPKDSLPALNENFGAPFAVQLSAFTSVLGLPCTAPPWGYVSAADLTTGEIVWQHKNGTVRDAAPVPLPFRMGVPSLGGPIMTAGGVAFLSGTIDYYVRAYDVTNGDQLWEARLPAGGQATPMTYLGADGRQYVLVAAGGHGSLGTKAGDYVIAYALPAS